MGTLGTNAADGSPVIVINPGSATDSETAKFNQLQASMWAVQQNNANDQFIYDGKIRNYNLNLDSGQQRVTPPPPVAPFKWVLAAPDANGYVFYERSKTERLTSPIPVLTFNPADPPKLDLQPDVTDIGTAIPGDGNKGWYYVGRFDTRPVGFTVTMPGPDGNPVKFQKWGSPWGYKYEVVG